MAIYKDICQHSSWALWMNNGWTLRGHEVAFGMPYHDPWSGGAWDWDCGQVAAKLCETTTYNLTGLYHGMEVNMMDAMWRWCVTNGSCLNGCAFLSFRVIDSGGSGLTFMGTRTCVNIQAPGSGWTRTQTQTVAVTGIDESDEWFQNGLMCMRTCACTYSGDDVSIPMSCLDLTGCCTPALCDIGICGNLWVEGTCLAWTGARGWKHFRTGCDDGLVGVGYAGSIWMGIEAFSCIHWIGCDGHHYHQPFTQCQFESDFSPGPGPNPNPGASYAGSIWADYESGGGHVNLAYIGCDGAKYMLAAGCCASCY